MELKELGTGQGYLKAGFLGFPKSGKTYTAVLLAIGLKQYLKLDGPIAFFDTETGSEYVAPMIRKATGQTPIGVRARSFTDMMEFGKAALKANASVAIVDSITHPWREVCEAHLAKINALRKANNQTPRNRLEFQDWNILKPLWGKWTEFYLNSKLHIIICGRAGYEWDFTEKDEETGKRELIKSGVKMKTEGEFGFEPSLLVEMERKQILNEMTKMLHIATVIGDRFGVIDGKQAENPGFDFFKPHVELLTPGAHAPVNADLKTDTGVDENGNSQVYRNRRERNILCEEIQGEMVRLWPGRKTEEVRSKNNMLENVFHTTSWTKVTEKLSVDSLRIGLERIRERGKALGEEPKFPDEPKGGDEK